MKEHLERMIQYVKETHLVESLMNASSLEERVKICEDARETSEFLDFDAHYVEVMGKLDPDQESLLSGTDFECTEDNAVAVAMVLIITGIDDIDMFEDFEEFSGALREVKGGQEKLANAIADFIIQNLISASTYEEVLEGIF